MSDKIGQWVENRFQGLDKAQLREAGQTLGVTFGPNTSEATMREKLCEKIGVISDAPKPDLGAPIQKAVKGEKIPNLTPKGAWEGRKRRVILRRHETEKNLQGRMLYFECEPRVYPFDVAVDLAWPHYTSIRDAKGKAFSQRSIRDSEGRLERMELVQTDTMTAPFEDHGITPGTESLPCDYQDYWRERAKRSEFFAKYTRPQLINVRSYFVGSVGQAAYRDVTNEEIRADILRHCGLEEVLNPIEEAA